MKVRNEMPAVGSCEVTQCAYNVSKNCHARAITVGDAQNPNCDTYLGIPQRSRETQRIAGVGACKVTGCKFNDDFECSAESILVGYRGTRINCLTFSK